jgi:hypothetical protein
MRCLALAQLRLTSTDEAALTDAADYLARAMVEVEALRHPGCDPVSVALGRALKTEHVSAPMGRVINAGRGEP